MFKLHSVIPAIRRLQLPLGSYPPSRQIYTRRKLQKNIDQLQEGLSILKDMVTHPKATDILQDVYTDRNDEYTESTSEDSRWTRVARRLNIPESYNGPAELIDSLTQYSPPYMYLPPSWHTSLGEFQAAIGIAFHCITSMFGKHIKFPQEKPIPVEFWPLFTDVPQPEPVWYQGQIKFIIIMVEQLSRSSIDVYTRLFTELYTASRYNTESDDENRMPSDYSRVHGLLTDRPTDEDLYVNPSSTTAPRNMAKVTEKSLSILMYAYNELLDDRRSHTDLVPKEHQVHWISTKTHNAPRSLSDALEEAAQYAKSATEILKQPANKDALTQGLDFLSESIRLLPLCEEFRQLLVPIHDVVKRRRRHMERNLHGQKTGLF